MFKVTHLSLLVQPEKDKIVKGLSQRWRWLLCRLSKCQSLHCQQQRSYSGLRSPRRSYSTYLWKSIFSQIHCQLQNLNQVSNVGIHVVHTSARLPSSQHSCSCTNWIFFCWHRLRNNKSRNWTADRAWWKCTGNFAQRWSNSWRSVCQSFAR